MTKRKVSFGVAGMLLGMPSSFIAGLLLGIAAPVAAIAAMAGLIYAATGKVPFLSHTWAEGEDQHLSFKLMPPGEAKANFERERTRISADMNKMSTEIQSLAEEAKAKAEASMPKQA